MISVEIGIDEKGKPDEVVEIYLDKDGLSELLGRLKLFEDGKTDHLHLMSESWGLGDLSESKHKDSNLIPHHLLITFENQ